MKRNKKKPETLKSSDMVTPPILSNDAGNTLENCASSWTEDEKIIKKEFPGPKDAVVPLRIAFDRNVYSEITEHVHQSLDAEVCGVLVGDFCEDDKGSFVHVRNMIAGSSAQQGSAHVTFTQETWNVIHARLEREFKDKRIVGWYHSHPGFGVTFSDMDLFIQKNFFSLPTQCALVIDPLGGDAALCINGTGGPLYIDRLWVDGREKSLYVPFSHDGKLTEESSGSNEYFKEYLNSLESRVNQVLQVLDLQHRTNSKLGLSLVLVAGAVLTFCLGYTFFKAGENAEPPELVQYVPLPVKIGNDTAMIGIGIVKWDFPPKMLAMRADFQEKQFKFLESRIREELIKQSRTENKKKGLFGRIVDFFKRPFSKKEGKPEGLIK